jgi:hypothetical protein
MKWIANTLQVLADTFQPDWDQPAHIQPMGLRQCTGILGPNQLAWCDQNIHHFKKARQQAEAAWAEPRLPLVDPENVLMSDYAGSVLNDEDVKQVIGIFQKIAPSST